MSYPLGLSWMLVNGFKNNPTKGLFLVSAGKIFLVCHGHFNSRVFFFTLLFCFVLCYDVLFSLWQLKFQHRCMSSVQFEVYLRLKWDTFSEFYPSDLPTFSRLIILK